MSIGLIFVHDVLENAELFSDSQTPDNLWTFAAGRQKSINSPKNNFAEMIARIPNPAAHPYNYPTHG